MKQAATNSPKQQRKTLPVLGAPIDAVSMDSAVVQLAAWADQRQSKAVCICNAHSVVTAATEPDFMHVLRQADMATPDGAPVAWVMRMLGEKGQRRVTGPDLMWAYLAHAAAKSEPTFLYGSSPATLEALQSRLSASFPGLRIVGALSPPFRALSAEEDQEVIDTINRSGAKTVWVGLGCPKQEAWITARKGQVQAVMVGVGAAFDFHAGTVKRAPALLQEWGLEWLYRLCVEPKRLWRRYLVGGAQFCWLAGMQLVSALRRREPGAAP